MIITVGSTLVSSLCEWAEYQPRLHTLKLYSTSVYCDTGYFTHSDIHHSASRQDTPGVYRASGITNLIKGHLHASTAGLH